MKATGVSSFLLLSLLGVVLAGAMVYLFQLRFSAGDIYPEYSSLRADPKGTRVLFESLEQLPEVEVKRNLRPLHRMESDAETTLLLTGVSRRLPDSTLEEIERFLESGARVVLSYYPFQEEDEPELRQLMLRPLSERAGEEETPVNDYETVNLGANFTRAFELELRYRRGPVDRRQGPLSGVRAETSEWLSGDLPEFWFSRLYLEPGDDWEILLRVEEEPVIVQRAYGDGTLVVMTDSYWLSNEAMRMTRRTHFATWLLGDPRTVVFEETHLGVAEQDRLSHLMRRMNLEPVLAVLLILAGFFLWKNGVAFPPRKSGSPLAEEKEVQGHESQKGLVNLLRANVSQRHLLGICWEEWLKSLEPAERNRLAPRIEAAEEVVRGSQAGRVKERGRVNDYQKVAAILNERKNVWKK